MKILGIIDINRAGIKIPFTQTRIPIPLAIIGLLTVFKPSSVRAAVSTSHTSPNYDGLTATFINLLHAPYDDPGFSVEGPTNGKYIIKTTSEKAPDLLKELQETFKSHGHTLARMPFQMMPTNSNPNSNLNNQLPPALEVEFPLIDFPLVEIEGLKGKEIFERLFSSEIRENNGNIVDWQESIGENKQIVYSYTGDVSETEIRKLQVNLFRQILSHASRADLYQAFAAGTFTSLPIPPKNILYSKTITGTGPLARHLKDDNLLTIRDNQGFPVVLFDALGLTKCLIAPKFVLEIRSNSDTTINSNAEITFDENDFLSYMSTIVNNGIFMHVKNDQLYPVAYPHAQAIQGLTLIDFIIDCSGSMSGEPLKALKKHLTTIIERLYKTMDPKSTFIKLSPFSSPIETLSLDNQKKLESLECPLTEKDKLIARISTLEISGGTALYKAIVESAEGALKRPNNMNKVSIYMTDGGDYDSPVKYYPRQDGSDLLSQTMKSLQNDRNPPKFFSIEIGDLTDHILKVLQEKTNGERIQANSDLSNFDLIYNYVGQFGLSRQYIDFVQEASKFRLEVLQGKITVSRKSLDPNRPFTMNDIEMLAKKPDVSSLFTLKKTTEQAQQKETIDNLQAQIKRMKAEMEALKNKQVPVQIELPAYSINRLVGPTPAPNLLNTAVTALSLICSPQPFLPFQGNYLTCPASDLTVSNSHTPLLNSYDRQRDSLSKLANIPRDYLPNMDNFELTDEEREEAISNWVRRG